MKTIQRKESKVQHIVIRHEDLNPELDALVQRVRQIGLGKQFKLGNKVTSKIDLEAVGCAGCLGCGCVIPMFLGPPIGAVSMLLSIAGSPAAYIAARKRFVSNSEPYRKLANDMVWHGAIFKDENKKIELKKGVVTYFDHRGNLVITNRKNIVELYKRWWQLAKPMSATK